MFFCSAAAQKTDIYNVCLPIPQTRPFKDRSEHDPTMRSNPPDIRAYFSRFWRRILYGKIQHFVLRQSFQSSRAYCICNEKWRCSFIKYCSCHEKWQRHFNEACTKILHVPHYCTSLWLYFLLLYYHFTLLFFHSTILWLYSSFTLLLVFFSTILWLHYSLLFLCSTILWLYYYFTLRCRSYVGSFSTRLPLTIYQIQGLITVISDCNSFFVTTII